MKLEPLGNRVIVEMLEEGGIKSDLIVIPESAKEQSTIGLVVEVGEGKCAEADGSTLIPIKVKIGEKVLVNKYGGAEIKYNGKTHKIFIADDIMCIVHD